MPASATLNKYCSAEAVVDSSREYCYCGKLKELHGVGGHEEL